MSVRIFTEFYRKNSMLIVFAAVLLIINILVFLFLTMPELNDEARSREALSRFQQQELRLKRVLAERRNILARIEGNRETLNYFYADVLGNAATRLNEILEERHDIGSQFGVAPTRVRYDSGLIENMPLERFEMAFPLNGTYESLRFFVDTLEKSDNFFILEDVQIGGADTETEELSMSLTVITFFHRTERLQGRQLFDEGDEL